MAAEKEAETGYVCEICGREHTWYDLRPEIRQSLIDARNGIDVYGPFDTVEEAIAAMEAMEDDGDITPPAARSLFL